MADWNLDHIAGRLEQAALDHTLWADVLDDLSHRVDAMGAILLLADKRLPGAPFSFGIGDLVADYFKDGWHTRDLRARGVPTMIRNGVFTDDDIFTREETARLPYYNDLFRKHGLLGFAGVGFKAGDDVWCVAVQRTFRQGHFEAEEVDRLARLWGPLSDAATLSRQLGFARVLGMADALELTGSPAVVFDDRGNVLAVNGLAETLMGNTIDVWRRRLSFRHPPSQKKFEDLLARAILGDCDTRRPGAEVLQSADGGLLPVRAVTLRDWARCTFCNARVLLLLGPPRRSGSESALLKSAFGLTAAEARLALELCSGTSLSEIAETFAIREGTARTQLKNVFSKTGTHRQSQLVALMIRLGMDPS